MTTTKEGAVEEDRLVRAEKQLEDSLDSLDRVSLACQRLSLSMDAIELPADAEEAVLEEVEEEDSLVIEMQALRRTSRQTADAVYRSGALACPKQGR